MNTAIRILALLLLVGAAATPVSSRAQDAQTAMVEEIRSDYQQLKFREAETKARNALATVPDFSIDQLVEIHTILAVITFSNNREPEARSQFFAALSLQPDLELDPLLYSPKILDLFHSVKSQAAAQVTATSPTESIRYVRVEDPRSDAAIRSLILPGWGQRYKGQHTKGWILMGMWGTLATGTILAHVRRQSAQRTYRTESNPDRVNARFDTFNSWHKARNNLALAAAGVWIFSYFDALLLRAAPTPAGSRLSLMPAPGHLYLRLRF